MKQILPRFLMAFILLFSMGTNTSSWATSQEENLYKEKVSNGAISLIENLGQWNDSARFKAELPGGVVFLTDYGFRYAFEDLEQLQKAHDEADERDVMNDLITTHAFDVKFENSLMTGSFQKGNARNTYHNYFLGNDESKWKSRVGLYDYVIHSNLYNDIDLVVYSNDNSFKYDLVVNPGGNVNDISIFYDGVDMQLDNQGRLKITTAVNEYYEDAPYTFQIINGQEVEVASAYKVTNGRVGFEITGAYNQNYPVMIDPELIFSTFSGATGSSVYSYASTYDSDGHHYGGADIRGSGWPTQIGVYQNIFGGQQDIAINKISPDGDILVYATYIGGSALDEPYALLVDPNDQSLYIAGGSQSFNMPMHNDAFIGTPPGGKAGFIFNISEDGTTLLGSTYLAEFGGNYGTFTNPGSYNNSVNFAQNIMHPFDILVTHDGEVWAGGNIQSQNIPTTTGAFQPAYGGGASDGYVMKFDAELSNQLFMSYIGGNEGDGVTALTQNHDGNIVITGITHSTDFPTTPGALIENHPGGSFSYGFVSVINDVTYDLMQSTYLGVNTGHNQAVDVSIHNNNVHVLGRTRGNYPVSQNAYTMGPDRDLFVHVLNTDLSQTLRSTTVGFPTSHNTQLYPTAFVVDSCGYTYIAGLSQSSGTQIYNGMPLTEDAFSTNMSNRFYFMVLDMNYNDLLFGSTFGSGTSDHTHMGRNRMDPKGIVYHSICANSQNYPITPGVFAPNKLNSGQDIISFKFQMGATSPTAEISVQNQDDTGCAPYTIQFESVVTPGSEILWDFGDGNTSTEQNPVHTYENAGDYLVVLDVYNDEFCLPNNKDSTTVTIFKAYKPIISVDNRLVCDGVDTLQLHVHIENPNANMEILWANNPGLLSPNSLPTVTVDPNVSTTYSVTVSDTYPGFCDSVSTATIEIDFAPRALSIMNNDTTICKGETILIEASGTPGFDYQWSPTDGVSAPNGLNPFISPLQSEVYTLTGSYEGCPDTSVTISVIVEEVPDLILSNDTIVCFDTKVEIEGLVTPYNSNYTYQWSPTAGLYDFAGPNAYTIADEDKSYALTVTSPNGCTVTDTFNLKVHPLLIASITDNTGYCPPDSVKLEVMGGAHYDWSPTYGLDRNNTSSVWASPEVPTEYTVVVTDTNQCKDTVNVFVDVYPLGVLNMPDTVKIFSGESYHLNPFTNAMYFDWFPPSGISDITSSNPYFSPEVHTRYFVDATTEHGCVIKDSIDFIVEGEVFDVPNAFHPKGEGNRLKIEKRGDIQLLKYEIYNRWGIVVYSSTDIDEGWDGRFKDEPQPMGVYVYVVEVMLPSGKTERKTGNVTLIR